MKLGYKGFKFENGQLKCLNYVFAEPKIGKQYITSEPLKMCHSGFHYCDNLKDVFRFYGQRERFQTKYYQIEITGHFINGITSERKSVCNSFKLVKELSKDDIRNILSESYKEKLFIKLDEVLDKIPDLIICGSAGLFLNGLLVDKLVYKDEINDLDFVTQAYKSKEEIIEIFGINKIKEPYHGNKNLELEVATYIPSTPQTLSDSKVSFGFNFKDSDYKNIDIFCNPSQPYNIIEYKSRKYKVASPYEAIKAKFDYAFKSVGRSRNKHLSHLSEVFKNLSREA